jgi:transposase-like protein
MAQDRVENERFHSEANSPPRTMPQLLLSGMPEGAIRINAVVSHLSKDGQVTWLLGADNYFFRPADDSSGYRLALATLMTNGHVRPCQLQKALGTAHRSLMRWRSQLERHGAGSFYQPQAVRDTTVLTAEKSAECQRLLDDGHNIAATARRAGIGESTLRKAMTAERVIKTQSAHPGTVNVDPASTTKSQRSRSPRHDPRVIRLQRRP